MFSHIHCTTKLLISFWSRVVLWKAECILCLEKHILFGKCRGKYFLTIATIGFNNDCISLSLMKSSFLPLAISAEGFNFGMILLLIKKLNGIFKMAFFPCFVLHVYNTQPKMFQFKVLIFSALPSSCSPGWENPLWHLSWYIDQEIRGFVKRYTRRGVGP